MSDKKKTAAGGKTIVAILAAAGCIILLLSNIVLGPKVEEALQSQASGEMTAVMPEGKGFTEVELPADAPATVKHIYSENQGLGYVVELATTSQYSQGDMGILVGVGKDGIITGTAVTSYNETRDFGEEYPLSYVGQDSALADVVMTSGATYSSTAFKDAILDAYTALFTFGDVAEGQKGDDQLIAEMMSSILPGACDALGAASMTEEESPGGNISSLSKATNGTGYVAAVKSGDTSVAAVINAFGVCRAYDMEGNDVTKDSRDAVTEALAAVPEVTEDDIEADKSIAEKAFEDEPELENIEKVDVFGTVTRAFLDKASGNYAFVAKPLGFGNETMSMVVVINDAGEIVNYRSASEMIINGEYYSEHDLKDESAYRQQFKGMTEDTYSQDKAMVNGATITSNAVHHSIEDAFSAFDYIKGGDE